MKSFFSIFLAILQFLGVSLNIIPVDTDIDYGGSSRPVVCTSNPVTVIDNDSTDYVIIISANPQKVEETAAAELQKYLKEMTGVTVPVSDDSAEVSEKEIIIGNTNRDVYAGIDFAGLGDEGFVLKADGKKLVICGGGKRGVIYGVYAFLEEQLGCRWYTSNYEYVPECKTVSFSGDLNDKQVPDFEIRRINIGWTKNESDRIACTYKWRTNVTYYQNYEDFGSGHDYVLWDVTLDRLVPDLLYDTNPEYFAYIPETGKRTHQHVCLSNPDVLEIAIKNAEKYIDENKTNADHIHIGQKDNDTYCRCENCMKLYEEYGSVSAPTIIFANKLSEALKEDGYDIYVTFYAYGETTAAPAKGNLKCGKNVLPVYCGTFYACHCHPFTECGYKDDTSLNDSISYRFSDHPDTKLSDEIKGWTDISERIYIYDYSINFVNDQIFLANLHTLQENTEFFRDIGVTGYTYTCGSDHGTTPFSDLRNYLYSKIMWNADSDIEYYIDDFLEGYYGAAAPFVKEYLNYITAKITASAHATNTDWSYQSAFFTFDSPYIDNLWKKAMKQELTEDQRYRTELLEISWRYTEACSFGGEFFFLNPFRGIALEKLYDDLVSHGITKISSLTGNPLPAKEDIIFTFSSPQDWR